MAPIVILDLIITDKVQASWDSLKGFGGCECKMGGGQLDPSDLPSQCNEKKLIMNTQMSI